jgi:uncharacterized Ntn-hydrolase superfamily protein
MNKIINITIKGLSALLMHAYPMMPIENPPMEKRSPEEQAELSAYRDPDTKDLYVPGIAIQRALIGAAAYSKGKGRASLQKQAAACLIVDPERVSLGVQDYVIDARPVVIPATKGRVMRFRPRLVNWQLTFFLEYDPSLLDEKQVRTIVDDAGSRVGLLDFRPERKGPFGRFMVTEWKTK